MHCPPRASPTRHDQNIQRWVVLDRGMRLDQQPAPTTDDPVFLSDRRNLKKPAIITGLTQWARHRKNLKGAAKIQYLDFIKDKYANGQCLCLAHGTASFLCSRVYPNCT